MIQFDVKEGKLFVVTTRKLPKELSSEIFGLIRKNWEEITMVKTPCKDWEKINFNESKFMFLENNQSDEEIMQIIEVHKAVSVMWVVRNRENLEKVNEMSKRVASLALIIGDDIEVGPDIKCLSLRIDDKSDVEEQLKKIDLPLRKETWRLARERRIEERAKIPKI